MRNFFTLSIFIEFFFLTL